MSDVAYARGLLHDAYPSLTEGGVGQVKAALYKAYRFLKPRVEPYIDRPFTERRVRAIHEGTARRIDGAEIDALLQAKIKEARNEQKALRARLASLDEMLAAVDPSFHGETLAALREQTRRLG